MTIDEMFNELEDKARDTFIVTLKYKYDFEKNYTIENHILEYDSMSDSYVWLNDWNEGQTDVEVLGYMPIGDVDTIKLEPSEDCISRKQAIRQCGFGMTSMLVADCLKKLPSVTPKTRWIPVSERMPEDGQDVLICDIDGDIMIGYHVRGRLDTHFSQQGSYEHIKNVKAWMPLPEPYKAESKIEQALAYADQDTLMLAT